MPLDFPAGRFELLHQIISRFFDGVGAGRARPDIDHGLNMSERFLAGKIFPDFFLTAALRFSVPVIAGG